MASLATSVRWLYKEFGLASVYHTGRDAWLVMLSRTCRMFAHGAISLIFALFFASLSFSDFQIGLFMTLTLVGDVLLSLGLTLVADRLGRRRVLFAGASLMVLSGAVFSYFENFVILLAAAIIGIVSATGGDFGPFRAIEESTISHLTTAETRSDVLSWYVTSSSMGSAAGTEFSGRIVQYLQDGRMWAPKNAYHAMFWLYIIMGIVNIVLVLCMSEKSEIMETSTKAETSEHLLEESQYDTEAAGAQSVEGMEQTSNSAPRHQPEKAQKKNLLAQISSETRTIMYKLWFLLTVDSLADGMVSLSWTYYYLDRKFQISKSTLGDISSSSYLLASCSTVFAGPLARRLGLINTMVFTHLPSSAAVLFFPLPQSLVITAILFFIRIGLNNMDQAPRTAFIAGVVKPNERTAVMGITSMLRTLASTTGPSLTGYLAGDDRFWIAFVAAGLLRISYDLGLWALFINTQLHIHESNGPAGSNVPGEEELDELDTPNGDKVGKANL